MTDAGHQADSYPPVEFSETAEPTFGSAGARLAWPGVARPAGWFLSAPEEAAPSGLPGTEPARPDNQDPAPATHEYVDPDERPTVTPWQPPVVGPTEALRGRAGGPGFVVPAGLVPGTRDPGNRSGWQLAQDLWQESGIDWDGHDARDGEMPPWEEMPAPLSAPTAYPAFDPEPAGAIAGDVEDELPRRRARPQRPEASRPPQDAQPAWDGWPAPPRPGQLDEEPDDELAQPEPFQEPESFEAPQSLWETGDEWGWQEPGGQARRWELANDSPELTGRFEAMMPEAGQFGAGQFDGMPPSAPRPPSPLWRQADQYVYGQPRPRSWSAADGQQPRAWHPSDERAGEYFGPDQRRYQPGYRRQEQAPDAPALGLSALDSRGQDLSARDQPPARRPWQDRPLDVRQPWENEPDRPILRGRRPRRTGRVWQAARVGVPVVLIAAVGGGALVLLTGKAHEVLSSTGSLGPDSPPPAIVTPAGKDAAAGTSAAFPGYPGLRGTVLVTSMATDGTTQLAVGSADGHAALWRRVGSGPWTLLRNRPGLPTGTVLTGIAHGAAGWLAVGNLDTSGQPSTATLASAGQQPVVLTSKDGVTWQSAIGNTAFSGPGFTVNAVAASSIGYVIVGEQILHGQPVDAMWFTPDLVSWERGGDTIASTVSSLSSGMSDSKIYAVAATEAGFVAVGTHNGCHTAWVTTDGHDWRSYDIPKPTGSQDPLLNRVAVTGDTVVAAGDLGTSSGRIPLIVVSTDGGVHWKMTAIGFYSAFKGPQGTVTALTADGSGFVAAGLSGPPGGQHAVTWTSRDGSTWSAATPAGQGTQQITALAATASPGSSIASVTKAGTMSVEVTAPAS